MNAPFRVVTGLVLLTSLVSCARVARPSATGPGHSNAATVINGPDLERVGGNLLSVLRGRVAGLQIRSTARAQCPTVTFRGSSSLLGDNSAVVYVDGTRAVNTCVLDMLVVSNIQRVELYPMGVAPRPPYKAHPNGLILVFLETGAR